MTQDTVRQLRHPYFTTFATVCIFVAPVAFISTYLLRGDPHLALGNAIYGGIYIGLVVTMVVFLYSRYE